MSFVVALALLIGVLMLVPLLAHLLRRGRAHEVPFPPTRLVPTADHVAKRRSRLEDRSLLALRAGIIFLLALVGATPLIRCEHAVLSRHNGASVAVVIVLDDSASMRNQMPTGETRFALAKRTIGQLVEQLHEGDNVGLILAGKPARIQLLPTTNPTILTQQLAAVHESDRATDLAAAIYLAESALSRQPHVDKRIVVVSDLGAELPQLSPRVSRLLPALAESVSDCGLLSATHNRGKISVEYACTKSHPNVERKLLLYRAEQPKQVLAEKAVVVHPGREMVSFEYLAKSEALMVRLLGSDSNVTNDTTPLADAQMGPSVATFADPTTGRGTTGGRPLLEQALLALDANLTIRSLSTVPEDEHDLTGVQLLLLDDPPLLSAESRSRILSFVEAGGTAVAFFGPAASTAQLGSLLLPFIERRATWETNAPAGLDPKSLDTLGAAAPSLTDFAPKGRFSFDESHDPKETVRGRWLDQKPFWIERPVGRGLVMTLGLPLSIAQSDLALRSGFVALLDGVLGTSVRLGLARLTTVGQAWRFAGAGLVKGEGPYESLPEERFTLTEHGEREFVPSLAGRYRFVVGGKVEDRIAQLPASEILEPTRPWPASATQEPDKATGRLDLTRPLILALLPLLMLELLARSTLVRDTVRRSYVRYFRRFARK